MAKPNGIRAKLLELAARPEGVGRQDLRGEWGERTITQGMDVASRSGGPCQSVGHGQHRRLFIHGEHAVAYAEQLAPLLEERRRQWTARAEASRQERRKAARAAARAKHGPPKRKVEPVVTRKAPSTSAKAVNGVSVPTYTTTRWKPDTPVIVPEHVQVQVCPSPPHFGPAAKLWGCR